MHRKAERENVLILNDVAKKEKEKPDLSRTDGFYYFTRSLFKAFWQQHFKSF